MGYVKLHDQFFASSIIEEDIHIRWVWVGLLLCCDKNGNVYGTRAALARKLNIEQHLFDEALFVLMKPDPNSTSQEQEGRRVIEAGNNLLHCVNYTHYRGMKDPVEEREKTRERVRKHRKRKACNAGNADVTKSNDKAESIGIGIGRVSIDHPKSDDRVNSIPFDDFWSLYPKKVGKKACEKKWRNLTIKEQKAAMAALPLHINRHWQGTLKKYIPNPGTWINQARWEDELPDGDIRDRSEPGWSLAPGAYEQLNEEDKARVREEEAARMAIRKEMDRDEEDDTW